MIKNLAAKAVPTAWRFQQRFNRGSSAIDVVQHLSAVRQVLVCLPSSPDYFEPALQALKALKSEIPLWQLSVVLRKGPVGFPRKELKADLIQYTEDDLNLLGMPRESLTKQIRTKSFDLSLDLLFEYNFLSFYLLKLGNAPLNICFQNEEKSILCNFEIRTNTLESIESKYQTMIKYVTAFANSQKSHEPAAA
jgi:hypothetical protein